MGRHLIGDYIHAHIRGYSKYGISAPNQDPSPAGGADSYNFMNARNRILSNFKRKRKSGKLSGSQARQMENAIGNLFGAADESRTNAAMKDCLQIIQSKINSRSIADGAVKQVARINQYGNLKTALEYEGQAIEINRFSLKNKIKNDYSDAKIRFGTIQKQYHSIVNQIQSQLTATKGTLSNSALQVMLAELNKAYADLEQQAQKGATEKGYRLINRGSVEQPNNALQTFLDITDMITNVPDSNNIGMALEYTGQAAAMLAFGLAENDIADCLNDVVRSGSATSNGVTFEHVGSKQVPRVFDYGKFVKGTVINGIGVGKGKIELEHSGTGKIDFSVKVGDSTEGINFSAKNANLSFGRGVHIGNYSSFLYVLQKIDDTNFVNHWLNVTAAHSSKTRYGKFEGASDIRASAYMEAHNSMKSVLAVLSMAGFDKEVDYLVINNNTRRANLQLQNPIRVIAIDDMINTIVKMPSDQISRFISVEVDGVRMANSSKNLWINDWVGEEPDANEGRKRINRLLSDLHAKKMSASLMPYQLLQIMGNDMNAQNYFNFS